LRTIAVTADGPLARGSQLREGGLPVRKDIGHHHPFPPEPIIAEDTRYVEAGSVRIGVEHRRLQGIADRLQSAYDGTPFEAVFNEWRRNRTAANANAPTVTTGMAGPGRGVSLHVLDADSGHEYLRFDCFDAVPHYHYLRPWTTPEECDNHSVDWDEVAHGPMTPWALNTLRTRLPEMLVEAGGANAARRLDPAAVSLAVDKVEQLVKEALATAEW
jgi:hypothetical protein